MNIVPTKSQMRVLTLMAAGFDVHRRDVLGKCVCRLSSGGVHVSIIRRTTADSLVDNGWATYDTKSQSYRITLRGRDRVDVKAFVRGLIPSQERA